MKATLVSPFDSQSSDPGFTRNRLGGVGAAVRADVVNRTHRVVRQKAKLMQARRDQVRSLMVPLILCSAFLILAAIAVWSGLYQYEATEAAEVVQADVAALADTNNHFLVVLLWFVPVSMAVLAAVWLRRSRSDADRRKMR